MELYKLSLFISNISHDVIMFHRQHQKRALTTRYIVGERGTYKVRNEIETKRNEINENETNRNETKSTKTKRNETKSTK